jgi:hypothetical protein
MAAGNREARKGRGRLSSIDTLPEWADEAKHNAFVALKERKLPQLEILDRFNAELRVAAIANGVTEVPEISSSAFNRKAMAVALLGRRLEETREIANVLAPKLDQAGDTSLTLLVAETIKTLISEMLSNAGELLPTGKTAEMLLFTSRALQHAEQAKRISAEGRRKIEDELKDKANKAIDTVAKAKGLSADTVQAFRTELLGLEKKKS